MKVIQTLSLPPRSSQFGQGRRHVRSEVEADIRAALEAREGCQESPEKGVIVDDQMGAVCNFLGETGRGMEARGYGCCGEAESRCSSGGRINVLGAEWMQGV